MTPIIIGIGAYLFGKHVQRKRDEKEVKEAMDEVLKDLIDSFKKERPKHQSYQQLYERHKRSNLDDIVIATRLEAEKVLVHLRSLIESFGVATIADLCDAVGMPCRHQDHIFGWTDLSTASISRVDAGYVIVFPFTRSVMG